MTPTRLLLENIKRQDRSFTTDSPINHQPITPQVLVRLHRPFAFRHETPARDRRRALNFNRPQRRALASARSDKRRRRGPLKSPSYFSLAGNRNVVHSFFFASLGRNRSLGSWSPNIFAANCPTVTTFLHNSRVGFYGSGAIKTAENGGGVFVYDLTHRVVVSICACECALSRPALGRAGDYQKETSV